MEPEPQDSEFLPLLSTDNGQASSPSAHGHQQNTKASIGMFALATLAVVALFMTSLFISVLFRPTSSNLPELSSHSKVSERQQLQHQQQQQHVEQAQQPPQPQQPALGASLSSHPRIRTSIDDNWKFLLISNRQDNCSSDSFPTSLNDKQCLGLTRQTYVTDAEGCREACCARSLCSVWQWCPAGAPCSPQESCWTGQKSSCVVGLGWVSQDRTLLPTPSPPPPMCTLPECQPSIDDSNWRNVNVPHDFVLEGNFTEAADKDHGYLPYGVGWYRKYVTIASDTQDLTYWIEFDGTQRNSLVYFNGFLLGQHASGYTPSRFFLDSSTINYDQQNVLAVRIDATEPDGWWYDGGGVYRHVWLTGVHTVHIDLYGVYVPSFINTAAITTLTKAAASAPGKSSAIDKQKSIRTFFAPATVEPEVTIANEARTGGVAVVVDAVVVEKDSGRVVAPTVRATVVLQPGVYNTTIQLPSIAIASAHLWSIDDPFLYVLAVTVGTNTNIPVDQLNTTFGIRSIRWDANTGFYLNEQSVKIQGMANHQDLFGVGVGMPDALQSYRVGLMKQMGANAWRTAHNPPNTELLDECDRQGLLVWDENHRNNIGQDFVNDAITMTLRDRNHPSVIMWSICNEVLCEDFNATSAAVVKQIFKSRDPKGSRPVTAAMNGGFGSDFQQLLDVAGVNYHVNQYDMQHANFPSQPMIGSETSSDYSDRLVYANDKENAYVSAYDENYPAWGSTSEDGWCAIANRTFMSGAFVWTGLDYKGEPTPYQWPNVNSHFGVMDMCGLPKDNFYYYQSVWLKEDVIHVLPHWTWNASICQPPHCTQTKGGGLTIDVWVYTNADSVELFVNGRSLGVQAVPVPKCRHLSWQVPYEAGNLTAVGHWNPARVEDSREVATTVLTAGVPIHVYLDVYTPSGGKFLKANGKDVAVVRISIVDMVGTVLPAYSVAMLLGVYGPGELLGMGNGDPNNHQPDKIPPNAPYASLTLWNGMGCVLVQSTTQAGQIELDVRGGEGLRGEALITVG